MPRITVIIPTLNEARYIGRTLESIKRQRFSDIEVIIADSMSTDGTVEAARRAYSKVRICECRKKGPTAALNKAAKAAKGDLLLFIDADTSVSKGMLFAYDKAFRENGFVAATGPIKPLERTSWGISIGFRIVSVYIIKALMLLGRPSIIGSNFVATREAYAKVNGMDESLATYYDWDLAHRLGRIGKVGYVPEAVAYTSVRRVKKWGALKYFLWHTSNAMLYQFAHKVRTDYEIIR
ncbi:MAG: glycosyltransferase [Candidatus Micrarchaeaceae archaeon]